MKVYTKDIKRQAKHSLAFVSETDSILIKGKREHFLKCQTGCLKRFDGMKLNRRKYISISEVISLSYISPVLWGVYRMKVNGTESKKIQNGIKIVINVLSLVFISGWGPPSC
jgi:hypothetical protein